MKRQQKKMKKKWKVKDYLSKLPDDILSKITSMLDIKDAVKTSILSKSWRYIWINRPDFTFNDFNVVKRKRKQLEENWTIDFVKVVDQIMQQRLKFRNHIKCFRLQFHVGKIFYPYIHHWIRYAIRDGLETLHLNQNYSNCLNEFEFLSPWIISENKGSLKHIQLAFYSIQCQSSLQKFDSLVSLQLDHVTISNSQLTMILECCPSLEKLIIYRCFPFDKLRIDAGNNHLLKFLSLDDLKLSEIDLLPSQFQSSLQKFELLVSLQLERVTISNYQLTKILECCPSIEKLIICRCYTLDKLRIEGGNSNHLKFLSLKTLTLHEIDLCATSLIFLELQTVSITSFELMKFIKTCTSLEKLTLHDCAKLTYLKICDSNNGHMKMLSLKWCFNLIEIDLCVSNLHTLEYHSRVILHSPKIKAPRLVNALIGEAQYLQFRVTGLCLDSPVLENLVLLTMDLPLFFKIPEDSLPEYFNVKHLFLLQRDDFTYRPSSLMYYIFKCFPSLKTLGLNVSEKHSCKKSRLKKEIACPNGTITKLELNEFSRHPYHVNFLKYLLENLAALEVVAYSPSCKNQDISHEWAHSQGNSRSLEPKDEWLRAIIPPSVRLELL